MKNIIKKISILLLLLIISGFGIGTVITYASEDESSTDDSSEVCLTIKDFNDNVLGKGINILQENEINTNSNYLMSFLNFTNESFTKEYHANDSDTNYNEFLQNTNLMNEYISKRMNISIDGSYSETPLNKIYANLAFGLSKTINESVYMNSIYYAYRHEIKDHERVLFDDTNYFDYSKKINKGALNKIYELKNKDVITAHDAENFFQAYGTHIVTKAVYGAKTEIFYRYTDTEMNSHESVQVGTKLKAHYSAIGTGDISGELNGDFTSELNSYSNSVSTYFKCNIVGAKRSTYTDENKCIEEIKDITDATYNGDEIKCDAKFLYPTKMIGIWNYVKEIDSKVAEILEEYYNTFIGKYTEEPNITSDSYYEYMKNIEIIATSPLLIDLKLPYDLSRYKEFGYTNVQCDISYWEWRIKYATNGYTSLRIKDSDGIISNVTKSAKQYRIAKSADKINYSFTIDLNDLEKKQMCNGKIVIFVIECNGANDVKFGVSEIKASLNVNKDIN